MGFSPSLSGDSNGLIDSDVDDQTAPAALRERLAGLLRLPDLKLFAGQARQWVAFDADGSMRGSADKMLMMLKMIAKIFSRTDKFVGMP